MDLPWHCTTDGATWPGCGTCGACRADAVKIFEQARRVRRRYEGTIAVLGKVGELVQAPPGIDSIVRRVEELAAR